MSNKFNFNNNNFNKINELSNQVIGTFCNIAAPVVNEVCNNLGQANLFDENLGDKTYPNAEIKENTNNINIIIFLPGAIKDSIKVKIDGAKLHISAISCIRNEIWSELKERNYYRNFNIPCNLHRKNLALKYDNGILYIDIKLENNIEDDITVD